jgi:hypothetical protein
MIRVTEDIDKAAVAKAEPKLIKRIPGLTVEPAAEEYTADN